MGFKKGSEVYLMKAYCKYCGKELVENYDLDEHEYFYESCDCETVTEINQYKEINEDLKHQIKNLENKISKNIWKIFDLEKTVKYR